MNAKSAIVPPAAIVVIGLGNMGVPMGACLMKAGYAVTGFDLSEPARGRFASAGGQAVNEVAAAVSSAVIVITLLPNGRVVRNAVQSMRPHLQPGCILVDMSSSDPIGTRKLGDELIAAGFESVDAPVSGGGKRATDGTLAIMVGGASTTIDRIARILSAMGRSIFRTGLLGSGHAMKALNNYVSAAGPIAAVEAIQIGRKFGLDPALMTDILNVSTGRNNTTGGSTTTTVAPSCARSEPHTPMPIRLPSSTTTVPASAASVDAASPLRPSVCIPLTPSAAPRRLLLSGAF